MFHAVVVDSNYGSITPEKFVYIQESYAKNGIELRLENYKSEEDIIAGCGDADVILGVGNPPFTRKVLSALPKLKAIQRFGIGVNSVDLTAAKELGILVLFMPGFCVEELALHATALIMALNRNLCFYDRNIRSGGWPKAQGPTPRNPRNLVLGLFGFGGSARPLYDIFHNGFGCKVISTDPFMPANIQDTYDIDVVTFDELLAQSDVISVHAPLTEETRHTFNYAAFEKMKSTAMIINIARGGLIHEDDLVRALDEKLIGFAGLDVFEQEPLPADHPLTKMDNVILSCHSAFYGVEAQQNQVELSIELVDSVLNRHEVTGKYIANRGVVSKIEGFVAK